MGIRAAKAGISAPVNPINPAFLHMYMPLLDGRFPYNLGPVELAALAMANTFPNVLLGSNGGTSSNGSDAGGGSNGSRGRNSCSPLANNNNNHSSSSSNKTSVHSRSSASSASPSPSGHSSQPQALNLRRSQPARSPCQGEDLRRKEDTSSRKPAAVASRSEDAPLNLSKPRAAHSRSSPLVTCPPSPSGPPRLQSSPPQAPHHQHHQQQQPPPQSVAGSPLAGLRNPPHPLLSPPVAGKFPAGLASWQPSPLFAPGFYSAPPFIPYNRSLSNGTGTSDSHDKPFPFGMFPLDTLPGFPSAAQSVGSSHHHHHNGSKKESPGSAGSVGGFSDSSNVDSEKKEDTVVTCQSECSCLTMRAPRLLPLAFRVAFLFDS